MTTPIGAPRPVATGFRLTWIRLVGIGRGIGSVSGPCWARVSVPAANAAMTAGTRRVLRIMVIALVGFREDERHGRDPGASAGVLRTESSMTCRLAAAADR